MKSCTEILSRAIAILLLSDRCGLECATINRKTYTLFERENHRQVMYNWLNITGYINNLTEQEKKIYCFEVKELPNTRILQGLNKYESIEPLLWVMGLSKKISNYDKHVITDFHQVLGIGKNHSLEELNNKCKMKSDNIIIEQKEISMLWHWRARIGKINTFSESKNIRDIIKRIFSDDIIQSLDKIKMSKELPIDFLALGMPYNNLPLRNIAQLEQIAYWRHHALEWVCSDEDWEYVDTST
jgi:hypothetical protein